MGVFLDYWWQAECPEEELVERLERLRGRIRALGVRDVSELIRIDPVCDPMVIQLGSDLGMAIPPAVRAALEQKTPPGDAHGRWCVMLGSFGFGFDRHFQESLLKRWSQTAYDFLRSPHGLWDESELPESLRFGPMTIYRAGMTHTFADALLRRGFVVCVDVDPGCESFVIGLSGYRGADPPLWLGSGMTKTQYAERFIHSHELLCRILDITKEEGLLAGANDTCGFYQHRDWSRSAKIVNQETTVARVVSQALAGMAAQSGGAIQVLSAPALQSYNLVNVEEGEKAEEKDQSDDPAAKEPRRPRKQKPSDEGPATGP